MARLGMLFGGPVLAAAVLGARTPDRRRIAVLAAAALPLLFWPLAPVIKQLRAGDDPSRRAAYYQPLLAFLARQPGPLRVEIAPTRFHWESTWVPRRFPITRGWERQLDLRYARLFYSGPLTASRYLRWLHSTGTGWVALPRRADADYAAVAERRLLDRGVPGLRQVWSSADWRVWRVPGVSLAPITRIGAEGFALDAGAPRVKIRWSRWWRPGGGAALRRTRGGWTGVATTSARATTVRAG